MANYYLEFEKPIEAIDQHILVLESEVGSTDHSTELTNLKAKRATSLTKIFSGLSRWQRVQLARHPQRPFSLDYIQEISPDFIELHGDRYFGDDAAVICGLGTIDEVKVAFIGQQKGRNTKENLHRNFGMMRPEGYRKALRIMKLAEKFNLPVISLIDTPGAYPGIGAEERGQSEAIARNLFEMSTLATPIISVVIGEGGSGGALAIGVADTMMMFEYSIYSVISPEGCASILYKDASQANIAAESLKLTSTHLKKEGLIDVIINEPLGGNHRDPSEAQSLLKAALVQELNAIKKIATADLLSARQEKLLGFGQFKD